MAAVLSPTTAPWHHPTPARPAPALRVLEGGRSARHARSHGVRHAAVLVGAGVMAAALVALLLVGGVRVLGAGAAAHVPAPSAVSPVAITPAVATDGTVVVRAGDTLWGIARSLRPSGDVRELVDLLAERAGGPNLAPGQRIDVRGLG